MNRLLQHFVDSGSSAAPSAPASRPPIPAPPQSSGGSYNTGNRGSYQRASPNGPFYYQPPPPPQYQQHQQPFGQHSEGHAGPGGLEEIPLSSQSTGGLYETVDLNADSSQQHRPYHHHQQRLFTPPARPPSTPNSQGRNYTPLYKAATPSPSGESPSAPFYQQQSAGAAAELFASGPPPAAGSLFSGPPSGSGGNPYRQSHGVVRNSPPKDPFGGNNEPFGRSTATDHFAAPRSGSSGRSFGHAGNEPFANHQAPVDNEVGAERQEQRHEQQSVQSEPPADPFGAPTNDANPFASTPANNSSPFASDLANSSSPFASAPVNDASPFAAAPANNASPFGSASANTSSPFTSPAAASTSPFESPVQSNGDHHRMASADSLFSSPAPTHNGDTFKPPQPSPSNDQAQDLFPNAAPSASNLFGSGDAHTSMPPPPMKQQAPSFPQTSPSPPKPPVNPYSSPKMGPQGGIPPPSPIQPTRVPPSPVKSDIGSLRLSIPAKSPLKSGLDVRHGFNAKIPIGKREDDAVSLAPSLAPSRMSMLSTLDDSLKLSDMYKQMTARLEGEKSDLLKVVASQAEEIAQMRKQIKSLELQLKKSRAQGA